MLLDTHAQRTGSWMGKQMLSFLAQRPNRAVQRDSPCVLYLCTNKISSEHDMNLGTPANSCQIISMGCQNSVIFSGHRPMPSSFPLKLPIIALVPCPG